MTAGVGLRVVVLFAAALITPCSTNRDTGTRPNDDIATVHTRLANHNRTGGTAWPKNPATTWTPTWDMARSTIIMPCNTSGFFDPAFAAKYGIADVDWSNARMQWANAKPMDAGEKLVEEIAKVKAINNQTHTWVYRNLVKALSWYAIPYAVCVYISVARLPSTALRLNAE